MNDDLLAEAEAIAQFLSGHLTNAGVKDPEGGRALTYTYTTDFFAWLCALRYKNGSGDVWLGRAIQACQAALDHIADWTKRSPAPQKKVDFHWEFKNLALLNVEILIGNHLPEPLASRLRKVLQNWQNLNIDSANWTAMRMLAYQMRFLRFRHVPDHLRSQLELKLLLSMQTPEGFFPDSPRSHSMQYHAYVLALLALYHRLTPDQRVRQAFLRGVRFVADFIDPAGDFNYYGRGQRQLFGYASMILALSEAARLIPHSIEAGRYDSLRKRVLQFVREHRCADGVYPPVLNQSDDHWGWYDYNNRGDYLAFCGVWFQLAASVPENSTEIPYEVQNYTRCYPELGLTVAARPNWFAAFSARGSDLSEPVGLIHLWPTGPLCLGGPEPARSMGTDYKWNYFGPIVNERPVLQRQRGTLSADMEALRILYSLPGLEIRQTFHWSGELLFEQTVETRDDQKAKVTMSMAGVSQPPDCLAVHAMRIAPSPMGLVPLFEFETCQAERSFTTAVRLADGDVFLQEQSAEHVIPHRHSLRRSIWQKLLKAVWILWVKAAGHTQR